MELGKQIVNQYFPDYKRLIRICEGGASRQESLYNGVKFAIDTFKESNLKIVSHCAARPLLPKSVLQMNLELIEEGKSVDTVKRVYDTMLYKNDQGKTRVH